MLLFENNLYLFSRCFCPVSFVAAQGGLHACTVKEINATASQIARCSFIYEGQDMNIEAHSLAKHTLGLSLRRHVWLLDPPELNRIPMNLSNDQ